MRATLRLLCALLAAALLLSACAGASPPAATPGAAPTEAGGQAAAPDPSGGGQITIGFAAPEFERSSYEPLIEAFNEQNPDVRVQFVPIEPLGGGTFDPSAMIRDTVSRADTAAPFFVRPEDVAAGLLYDLGPLIEADPLFAADDFFPGALDALRVDGKTYLVPRTLNVPLLSYSRAMWDSAGLAAPSAGWSWEDLIAAAEQIARKNGDEVETYGYVGFDGRMFALLAALGAAGVDFATPADQAQLDSPTFVAALERAAALVESGAFYDAQPGAGGNPFEEIQELIRGGRAGIWPEGMLVTPPGRPGADPEPQADVDAGSVPYPNPAPPSDFGAQGYVISSGTQHPQEAWRWISFLSRQEIRRPGGVVRVGGGLEVPARRSIAEQTGFWNNRDEQQRAAIEAALEQPRTPDAAGREQLSEVLRTAFAAVLEKGVPADQALAEAQASLSQRLAEATTPTPGPPVVVATPEPDVAPEGATPITFAALGSDPARLRDLARQFMQEHPEIFVDIQSGFRGGPVTGGTLASEFDCFAAPKQLAGASTLTATLDLQPLIDADPAFGADEYPEALMAPFRRDGGLYGLPYSVAFRVLKYNKEAFEQAGLAPPSADWTLDDFLQAAQQLTSGSTDADKRYGFASNGIQTEDLRFFLDRLDAPLVKGAGEAALPNYTDPAVQQAVEFYIDLLKNASPHEGLQGYEGGAFVVGGETFQLVQNGRVGMWFDFGLFGFEIRIIGGQEAPAFTTLIAPPPLVGTSLTENDMRVIGLYISAQSQQQQACWEWLKFLSRDTSLLGGSEFPARRPLAESPAFLQGAPEGAAEVYEAYRPALDVAPAQPEAQGQIDYYWFFRAVDRALEGQDLERELAEAQSLTEQHLACVRGGEGAGACARLVDPEYKGLSE